MTGQGEDHPFADVLCVVADPLQIFCDLQQIHQFVRILFLFPEFVDDLFAKFQKQIIHHVVVINALGGQVFVIGDKGVDGHFDHGGGFHKHTRNQIRGYGQV